MEENKAIISMEEYEVLTKMKNDSKIVVEHSFCGDYEFYTLSTDKETIKKLTGNIKQKEDLIRGRDASIRKLQIKIEFMEDMKYMSIFEFLKWRNKS